MEYEKAVMIMREVIIGYWVWNGDKDHLQVMDDGTKITKALIDEAFNKIKNG